MTPRPPEDRRDGIVGGLYAIAAFGFWGLVPVYWKAVGHVAPYELLAHRAFWAFVFLVGLLLVLRRVRGLLPVLRRPRQLLLLAATAGLVALNWFVFIWAMQHDRVLEASLGYYVNPLVNVLLGYVFLAERLRRLQWVAVVLASIAVLNLILEVGVFPWVSLVLALTFGFYGLLRKMSPVGAIEGLTVETGLMLPFAAGAILLTTVTGGGAFLRAGVSTDLLIVASGLITALPLVWFAAAARRLRYGTVGFFQYLAPTGHFLLAVLAFGEPFTHAHSVTFGLIWVALLLYTIDAQRTVRRRLPGTLAG